MAQNSTVFLKPHHFLDIIKLYGTGLHYFIPDPKYKHHFYKIGNLILRNPQTNIILTTEADDICKPCIFLKNGKCTDTTKGLPFSLKEEWNQRIDKRILEGLNLKTGNNFTVIEICKLFDQTLTQKKITKIWKERPNKETRKRIKYLLQGLRKYILSFSPPKCT